VARPMTLIHQCSRCGYQGRVIAGIKKPPGGGFLLA
jgi:hypothetical protein